MKGKVIRSMLQDAEIGRALKWASDNVENYVGYPIVGNKVMNNLEFDVEGLLEEYRKSQ